jgi:hypothetical protein
MRIVLSRKGFDSSAGGCPNPVFPDGSLFALPIPDPCSAIAYRDVHWRGLDAGALASELTGDPGFPDRGAHLDPDLIRGSYPRARGWRPLLGQTGAAGSHLHNQGVGTGDLFLFFALFRPVEPSGPGWRFVPGSASFHALWGWLQVDQVVGVDDLPDQRLRWARYHPHFQWGPDPRNTLYIARRRLALPDATVDAPGAGVFGSLREDLRLTAPDARQPSRWRLPGFFMPTRNRPPLSYHHRRDRWQRRGGYCHLQAAARGQEFVLQAEAYPETGAWLRQLFARA